MAIWGVEEYGGDLPCENVVPQKHSPPVSFQAQPVAWSQTTDMENLEKSNNILVSKPYIYNLYIYINQLNHIKTDITINFIPDIYGVSKCHEFSIF